MFKTELFVILICLAYPVEWNNYTTTVTKRWKWNTFVMSHNNWVCNVFEWKSFVTSKLKDALLVNLSVGRGWLDTTLSFQWLPFLILRKLSIVMAMKNFLARDCKEVMAKSSKHYVKQCEQMLCAKFMVHSKITACIIFILHKQGNHVIHTKRINKNWQSSLIYFQLWPRIVLFLHYFKAAYIAFITAVYTCILRWKI